MSAAWAFTIKEHKHGVNYCMLHLLCPNTFDIKNAFPTCAGQLSHAKSDVCVTAQHYQWLYIPLLNFSLTSH